MEENGEDTVSPFWESPSSSGLANHSILFRSSRHSSLLLSAAKAPFETRTEATLLKFSLKFAWFMTVPPPPSRHPTPPSRPRNADMLLVYLAGYWVNAHINESGGGAHKLTQLCLCYDTRCAFASK